ncbi:MAG: phage terminase large subunit [Methanocorpusculum sp.]|nr:phage terminase large subunit [Methanocorpusculum sp.]
MKKKTKTKKQTTSKPRVYDIPALIGKGYNEFWNFKGRFRVVKGSRNSKKSTNTAYWIVLNMKQYPLANTLVVHRYRNRLKETVFSQIMKVIVEYLHEEDEWKVNNTTLTITRIATGQEIRFAGMDEDKKQLSITVVHGFLCWLWIDEASEIETHDKFLTVWHSFRGEFPEGSGLFVQATLTFNPWHEFWVKDVFFDRCDRKLPTYDAEFAKDCLCLTRNHYCNEWASEADHKELEDLQYINPRRWRVECLGEWGVEGEIIYNNWKVIRVPAIGKEEMMRRLQCRLRGMRHVCGLDFGYEDPTALIEVYADLKSNQAWVFKEVVLEHACNRDIGKRLRDEYRKELIIADSADKKARAELRRYYGFTNIAGSRKGPDSVADGIQFVKGFKHLYIFADCPRTIHEIQNYCYERDKTTGELTQKPVDKDNHCMDAMRYALSHIARGSGFRIGRINQQKKQMQRRFGNMTEESASAALTT